MTHELHEPSIDCEWCVLAFLCDVEEGLDRGPIDPDHPTWQAVLRAFAGWSDGVTIAHDGAVPVFPWELPFDLDVGERDEDGAPSSLVNPGERQRAAGRLD